MSFVVTLQWTVISLNSVQPVTLLNYEGMECKRRLPIGMVMVTEGCDVRKYLACSNPLKMKRRPLYLKTQSVLCCKHFSSRL
jgi:hypothetical protein